MKAKTLTNPPRPKRKGKKPGPKGVSEGRIAHALRKNGGCMAAAARSVKIKRSSIRERILRSEVLLQAMHDGRNDMGEVAVDNVMQRVWDGDDIMTRYYLDRRHPDFIPRRENREIPPPPDPEAEARHQQLVAFFAAEIERRARAGLPPVFGDLSAGAAPQPPVDTPMIDVTPKKTNGKGNGHA